MQDIVKQPRAGALVLAAHGLCFRVLDDLQPLREMSRRVADADQFLFTAEMACLVCRSSGPSRSDDAGENPANGGVVYHELTQKARESEKVCLTFSTQSGEMTATFTNKEDTSSQPAKDETEGEDESASKKKVTHLVPAKDGMNRFAWDMRYPDATKAPGAIPWSGNMQAPKVAPGTWKVALTVGGTTYTRYFKVEMNPNNPATWWDFEAQLALLQKIHDKLNQTNDALLRIREMRHQLGQGSANKAKVAKFTEIENILVQTRSYANEDPLNYPMRLNNQLPALAGVAGSDFGPATRTDQDVYAEVAAQVDRQVPALGPFLQ